MQLISKNVFQIFNKLSIEYVINIQFERKTMLQN